MQYLGDSSHRNGQRRALSTLPNLARAFQTHVQKKNTIPVHRLGPRQCRSIPKKSGHPPRADRPEGAPPTLASIPRWACSHRPLRDAATARGSSAARARAAVRRPPPPPLQVVCAARKRPRRQRRLPRQQIARRKGGGRGSSGGRRRRPRRRAAMAAASSRTSSTTFRPSRVSQSIQQPLVRMQMQMPICVHG